MKKKIMLSLLVALLVFSVVVSTASASTQPPSDECNGEVVEKCEPVCENVCKHGFWYWCFGWHYVCTSWKEVCHDECTYTCVPNEPGEEVGKPAKKKLGWVWPDKQYISGCDEACGEDFAWEEMTNPPEGKLHVIYTLRDRCNWKWSFIIDGWDCPLNQLQRVYAYSQSPFTAIYGAQFYPAELRPDGRYFLSVPGMGKVIYISGLHEGSFTWPMWSELTRVRDAGIDVEFFTSCRGGIED